MMLVSVRRCIGLSAAFLVAACGAHGDTVAMADSRIDDIVAAPKCTGALTGRRIGVDAGTLGFGREVKPSGLALKAGEYVLTFDDGPTAQTLPTLLQILESNCVNATFFLVGQKAAAHPELVKAILEAGHSIGSHSWDHSDFAQLGEDEIEDNMRRGADAVEESAWDRAPLPDVRRAVRLPGSTGYPAKLTPELAIFLKRNDFLLASVDASPEDWRNDLPIVSYRRLFANLPDRGVILMHDWPSNSPALLRLVLARLKQDGAKIVAINLPGEQATAGADFAR